MNEHNQRMKADRPKRSVALTYNENEADAPVVKAKGAGISAESIIQLAKANDIPIMEDPSLVELLYKIDINEQIPVELYNVVADILAFVYEMERKYEKETLK